MSPQNFYAQPKNTTQHAYSAQEPFAKHKNLRDFTRPDEVLMAIRGALLAHKRAYMSTGSIHGNISVDTIYLGNGPFVPGFLLPNHATPNPDDLTFKSVMSLSHMLQRKHILPVDYLDELESFYYVLTWMCYAYEGTDDGRPYPIASQYWALPLARWANNPDCRDSILEKEAMLFAGGVSYSYNAVSAFWGGERFQKFLDQLAYVLCLRYTQKMNYGLPRTLQELRADAEVDYGKFLSHLDTMIQALRCQARPNRR